MFDPLITLNSMKFISRNVIDNLVWTVGTIVKLKRKHNNLITCGIHILLNGNGATSSGLILKPSLN